MLGMLKCVSSYLLLLRLGIHLFFLILPFLLFSISINLNIMIIEVMINDKLSSFLFYSGKLWGTILNLHHYQTVLLLGLVADACNPSIWEG
jgi:hypothetical protein